MEFEKRLQDARAHVDQTRGAYERAKQETGQAISDYNESITTAPNFQTYYEKYKQQYQESEELKQLKSDWQEAKQNTDGIRSSIDKLSESINQQFGGTSLTQAQRDMAKRKQQEQLNKQFMVYNADYQTKLNSYNKKVESAFQTSMDLTTKDYNRYWKTVQKKFEVWKTRVENEKQWSDMYRTSQNQLMQVNEAYKDFQMQQQIMQRKRESVSFWNNFAAQQRQMAYNSAVSSSRWAEEQAQRRHDANQRFAKDVSLLQRGKLSASDFSGRINSGIYAT